MYEGEGWMGWTESFFICDSKIMYAGKGSIW